MSTHKPILKRDKLGLNVFDDEDTLLSKGAIWYPIFIEIGDLGIPNE